MSSRIEFRLDSKSQASTQPELRCVISIDAEKLTIVRGSGSSSDETETRIVTTVEERHAEVKAVIARLHTEGFRPLRESAPRTGRTAGDCTQFDGSNNVVDAEKRRHGV